MINLIILNAKRCFFEAWHFESPGQGMPRYSRAYSPTAAFMNMSCCTQDTPHASFFGPDFHPGSYFL